MRLLNNSIDFGNTSCIYIFCAVIFEALISQL